MSFRRTVLIGSASFLTGALVTGLGAYFWLTFTTDFVSLMPYQSAASSGQLYVSVLRQIHSGKVDKATRSLEAMVDMELITIGSGADYIRRRHLESTLAESVSAMRDYRHEFPSTQSDPAVRHAIQRGLSIADQGVDAHGP